MKTQARLPDTTGGDLEWNRLYFCEFKEKPSCEVGSGGYSATMASEAAPEVAQAVDGVTTDDQVQ